jgi:hypothetical protein
LEKVPSVVKANPLVLSRVNVRSFAPVQSVHEARTLSKTHSGRFDDLTLERSDEGEGFSCASRTAMIVCESLLKCIYKL